MKPVDQTDLTSTHGNCLSACVASILELSLADVPWFSLAGEQWWDVLAAWVRTRGLGVTYYVPLGEMHAPRGYSIVGGASPRFPGATHACVAYDGNVVHDPHPSRVGLTNIKDFIVIHGPSPANDPMWFNGIAPRV